MENIAFLPIAPEVALLVGALLVLLIDITLGLSRKVWGAVAAATLLAAIGFSVLQWIRVDQLIELRALDEQLSYSARGIGPAPNSPMVVLDHFSAFAGIAIFTVGLAALASAWSLIASLGRRGVEFTVLFLLALAGLHMMAMSSNLILLFIGLETASISLYIIAGFTRDTERSDESAIKYFLLGSFASAIFLYGIALIFAVTGTTTIYGSTGIIDFFRLNVLSSSALALVGIGMVVVGLAFKVSAAPFHQWAPDVYQGAPSAAVPMMSAGVKIAGFAALARILTAAFPAFSDDWAPLLAGIAILSVVVGTFNAIGQTDLKRMLGYSGVAHAGFIMTALVAGADGVPAMWFYVSTYALQLVGAFTIVAVVSGDRSDRSPFDDIRGLGARSPFLAATLALFMIAMGGIPFTAGFIGKVSVFTAAAGAGYLWLAIAALVAAVAGLFFYLRVIVLMYFDDDDDAASVEDVLEFGTMQRAVIGVCAVATVLFGVAPWPLLNFVDNAIPF